MALDLCSHDAPGQQPGTPCLRCNKMLPGEAPKQEVQVVDPYLTPEELPQEEAVEKDPSDF